jgi:hypothetical protein
MSGIGLEEIWRKKIEQVRDATQASCCDPPDDVIILPRSAMTRH